MFNINIKHWEEVIDEFWNFVIIVCLLRFVYKLQQRISSQIWLETLTFKVAHPKMTSTEIAYLTQNLFSTEDDAKLKTKYPITDLRTLTRFNNFLAEISKSSFQFLIFLKQEKKVILVKQNIHDIEIRLLWKISNVLPI